jgi:hypothetical protein
MYYAEHFEKSKGELIRDLLGRCYWTGEINCAQNRMLNENIRYIKEIIIKDDGNSNMVMGSFLNK